MAREVQVVWVLECELIARSALAVGGLDGATDLPVARDGQGRPFVPGTTLAGCLRALVARHLDDLGLPGQVRGAPGRPGADPAGAKSDVERLFGFSTERGDGGEASPLLVADATLDAACVLRRDGVGLDRRFGSAADGILYSREVVGAGAKLKLRLEVEARGEGVGTTGARSLVERLLPRLAWLLATDGLRVGAATGRGLGHLVPARAPTLLRLDLARADHLHAWWRLRSGLDLPRPTPQGAEFKPVAPTPVEDLLTLKISWEPAGPVMVRAGGEGKDTQILPLTVSDREGRWRAAIPGSSIRGALRSHAERIVRTLRTPGAPLSPSFLDQVQVEVVSDLFGRARSGEAELARGVLRVDDCLHRQALPLPPDGRAGGAPQGWRTSTHVAVDRWTGGALDSALFQVLEPCWEGAAGRWDAIQLELDLHRLTHTETPEGTLAAHRSMALFWLVLRDLASGALPLGFGTRRGMGRIKVTKIEAWHLRRPLTPLDADMWPLPDDWKATIQPWEDAWKTFAKA